MAMKDVSFRVMFFLNSIVGEICFEQNMSVREFHFNRRKRQVKAYFLAEKKTLKYLVENREGNFKPSLPS